MQVLHRRCDEVGELLNVKKTENLYSAKEISRGGGVIIFKLGSN